MSSISKIKNKAKKIVASHNNNGHVWQFSRVGGVNRVNLMSGADLLALDQLDKKLWAALSCPVDGLEIDPQTLQLIDTDKDNRIRVPEVLAAVKWITSVINDPDDLLKEQSVLPLSAINNKTDEGKILLASARQILKNLGKPKDTTISVQDTSNLSGIFAETQFNGDGIITEKSTADESLKKIITQIIATVGSSLDRSEEQGVSSDQVKEFYEQCEAYCNWYKLSEDDQKNILPFGDKTADAVAAFQVVESKVNDYFLRCRLSEYDPESKEVFGLLKSQYEAFSSKELSVGIEEMIALPIAKMNEKKSLPLTEGINPAWENAMKAFYDLVILPLFPKKTQITQSEWESIVQKVNVYRKWQAEKQGAVVESLGIEEVRTILKNNQQEALHALIGEDLALETEVNNMLEVDKLTRFYRDIFKLLKNYVNFSDFYSLHTKAVFQAGCLYIDQRRCDLCIKVNDMAKHGSMAGLSDMFLIYCDCVSRAKGEKMTIVAALTDGSNDNMIVGRNAVFYDRKGNDWDATIIKIIDNPVSIKEAFWSPYKKVGRFISEQIEKFASKKDKDVMESTTGKIEATGEKLSTGDIAAPAAAPVPFDIGKFVGIFAALSLALGAIGSFLMTTVSGFFSLKWWQMPLAIVAVILAISLPSMVLAYLKLRKRNLAPVLDANGWAINARLAVNIIFGRELTHLAVLPENSKVNMIDPFKKKQNPWLYAVLGLIVALIIAGIVLWYLGILPAWIGALKQLLKSIP
ncbi:MAG: hypothetical protein BWY08_00229 [Bacteroidetes bacterium ADurb.Bin174]|nr:MAG: hypothetical protein BWY08_00229 [Bacteroidetes bacterium ADurb.Bin174]